MIPDEIFPEFMEKLVPVLRKFIEGGTPKQSKQAVRCLHRNLLPEKHELFKDIFEVNIILLYLH